jgi:hypothetical protein
MADTGDGIRHVNRRRFLGLAATASLLPLIGSFPSSPAQAATEGATPANIRFRASHRGETVGEHSVTFRADGERLSVVTRIDITVKVLFFTAFRLKHDAEEIWQSGRLVSVQSTTNNDGVLLKVSGYAAADGFRILGADGPFLAPAHLLTSNTLWDSKLVHESKLIDVQHGSEVGMVAKLIGAELVDTPQGRIRASHHQIITPHYAGSIFHDGGGRWVKGSIERQGELLEYALVS